MAPHFPFRFYQHHYHKYSLTFIKGIFNWRGANKHKLIISLCSSLFFSAQLHAADQSDPAETKKEQPNLSFFEPLDDTRDSISKNVVTFANWADNYFGSDVVFDESQKSHLKLNIQQVFEEGHEPRYEINLLGKLSLPNTSKRLELLIASDAEEDGDADDTVTEAVESQEQSVGLRYIQYSSSWVRAHTDMGVRLRSGFDTFLRFRLRGLFSAGRWRMRASETVFWRDSEGWGETSRLDIERPLQPHFLFRSVSQATWLKDDDELDIGQSFLLIHDINRHRAVVYRAGLSATSKPELHTTGYIVSIRFRELIHRDWLFFEITPAVNFPKDENFHSRHSLNFKLETLFGGI